MADQAGGAIGEQQKQLDGIRQALPGIVARAEEAGVQRGVQAVMDQFPQAGTAGPGRSGKIKKARGPNEPATLGEAAAGTATAAYRGGEWLWGLGAALAIRGGREAARKARGFVGADHQEEESLVDLRIRIREEEHEGQVQRARTAESLLATDELVQRLRPDVADAVGKDEIDGFDNSLNLARTLAGQAENSEKKVFEIDPGGIKLYQAMDKYEEEVAEATAKVDAGEEIRREWVARLKKEWEKLHDKSLAQPAWHKDFTDRFGKMPDSTIEDKDVRLTGPDRGALPAPKKEENGEEPIRLGPANKIIIPAGVNGNYSGREVAI